MQSKIIFLLFAGHLMTDISQGMVPALLPYFISEYQLTYSAAGFLILALTLSSSIVQPLFGYLADKRSLPWFVALGPLLAGLGIAIAGLFHQYYMIVTGVFLCGLGIAAFHPEGARMAGIAAGDKKASGMSLFSVGGNAGFALGPVITVGLIYFAGLKGIAIFFIPALIMAIILFLSLGRFSRLSPVGNNRDSNPLKNTAKNIKLEDAWKPFILLTLAIIFRSILHQGINAFLPFYWIETFHASKEWANMVLTIFLGLGVVGNLVGGRLADRVGYQKMVFGTFMLLIPQLLIFVNLTNATFAMFLLMTIGFTIFASFSATIVMGQQFLPNRVGFASGITIGLAVSMGGFASPILGRLADLAGVQAVFQILVVFPILSVLFVYLVPKVMKKQVKEPVVSH